MQFKTIAIAFTAISSVSAWNATNGSNGTNSTTVVPDNGAAGISTGALGVAAAAAAGVALLFYTHLLCFGGIFDLMSGCFCSFMFYIAAGDLIREHHRLFL